MDLQLQKQIGKEDKNWSFSNLSRRETNYLTHGYHKYPAKFIPQVVSKIIEKYSSEGDWILDPFGGCGTTLVESKLNGRNSIGIDINDIAVLISKTKISEINPKKLEINNKKILNKITKLKIKKNYYKSTNQRLKYWFKKNQFNKLMELYNLLRKVQDKKIKTFYLCCFSNILKNCSIWYSKSIKPMRDPNKLDQDPLLIFKKHVTLMTDKNKEFFNRLNNNRKEKMTCIMQKGDARNLSIESDSINLVITSPPYFTSYEYAELHQLSTLWFGFAADMNEIKEKFIGTAFRKDVRINFESKLADKIIKMLNKKDKSLAKHATNYFSDLKLCYEEIYRVLKNKGKACIIIGNTEYKGIKIKNMETSLELLKILGFKLERVIKRRLSSKTFTPFRDENGRFTNSKNNSKKTIYKYEYIVVVGK